MFFCSCSSGNGGQGVAQTTDSTVQASVPGYDHALPKGKATDSIACSHQPGNTYALYLPSWYTPAKSFPCIFLFDAHARGLLPVSMYKALAEQYGIVLIGSNASKNGTPWQVTSALATTLMADVQERINIDQKQIYTGGFSGGSRVASSVAIKMGGIAGVIGCAAGFPQLDGPIPGKFSYFGLVGDDDFNLAEMERLDEMLGQHGFAHQLLTFSGKHGWPAMADFGAGLLWLQVMAMKEQRQPKSDTLVADLKKDYNRRIASAKKSGNVLQELELLNGMVAVLERMADVTDSKRQATALAASPGYKNAIAEQAGIQEKEMAMQQELAQQFAAKDEPWWTKKIAELNSGVHGSAKQHAQMYRRLLNYLGLVGYMNSNHAINAGDLTNTATYLHIFKMADPENPDCSYLTAVYYMKKGDARQGLAVLKDAAASGYSEVNELMTNPIFASLQGTQEFKDIVAKVRSNNNAAE